MRVFKFGGASVKDAQNIENVKEILNVHQQEKLLVVISAIGKTTNKLEIVNQYWYQRRYPEAIEKLFEIRQEHIDLAIVLVPEIINQQSLIAKIDAVIASMKQILQQEPHENFNLNYDQIVSHGEILSTVLISFFLNYKGVKNFWLDARSFISTNDCYRDARVYWQETEKKIAHLLKNEFLFNQLIITQGFIGKVKGTNYSTTLGREGSDYTASIFAYGLNAKEVVIWKDVAGVLNADPRLFPMAQKIDFLSYQEAVELTYHGASVIHPKTIKPLQNKGIPLRVQSFLKPNDQGTLIAPSIPANHPVPFSIIVKSNQALISFQTKDFGFIAEESLSIIFSELYKTGLRVHMMQNSAMQFAIVVDYDSFKLNPFLNAIEPHFKVTIQNKLSLITFRHASEKQISGIVQGKTILMEQYKSNTAQLVLK